MDGFLDLIRDITIYFSIFYPLLYIKSFVSNNKAFKIFTIYLVVIAIIQFSLVLIVKMKLGSNIFLSHFYFTTQFVLLSLFYAELLKFKWIIIVMTLVLIGVAYQFIDDPSLFYRYNPSGFTVTQLLIVIYALLYFYKSLSKKNEFLIVNIGIFFYLLSSALIFASGNLIFDVSISESVSATLGDINIVLYLAFQFLIFVEWWKNYSIPKIKS